MHLTNLRWLAFGCVAVLLGACAGPVARESALGPVLLKGEMDADAKIERLQRSERNALDAFYSFASAMYFGEKRIAYEMLSDDAQAYLETKGGAAYFSEHFPFPHLDLGKTAVEWAGDDHVKIFASLFQDPAVQSYHVVREDGAWKVDIRTRY